MRWSPSSSPSSSFGSVSLVVAAAIAISTTTPSISTSTFARASVSASASSSTHSYTTEAVPSTAAGCGSSGDHRATGMTSLTDPPLTCDASRVSTTPKTIYLIRHAQSEENRRLASLQSVAHSLSRLTWPRSSDITASLELLSVSQQVDSPVSDTGNKQIAHMAHILREQDFVAARGIQLVAHSPLIRARETCRGMLGCCSISSSGSADGSSVSVPASSSTATTTTAGRMGLEQNVYELDVLKEKTPLEWIPGNSGGMYQRIRALEDWLAARPEHVICLVGHSQFFKAMLKMDSKFGNCDVMQVQFVPPPLAGDDNNANANPPTPTSWTWNNVTPVHLCRMPSTSTTTGTGTGTGTEE